MSCRIEGTLKKGKHEAIILHLKCLGFFLSLLIQIFNH